MGETGVDFSELRAFSADLSTAPAHVASKIPPVVAKGALNIKQQMQAEMGASAHFKGAARDISYDLLDDGFTAEIGPQSGPGHAGALANIAYFGGSNGGGGTVADPRGALEAEVPGFEAALRTILDGAL